MEHWKGTSTSTDFLKCRLGYQNLINTGLFDEFRLGHMFSSPIFSNFNVGQALEHVQYVDEKRSKTDYYRILRVERETANNSHPFSQIAIGKFCINCVPVFLY